MAGQQDLAKASRNLAAWLGLSTTHLFFFLALSNKTEEKQRAKEIPKNKKKSPIHSWDFQTLPALPWQEARDFCRCSGS